VLAIYREASGDERGDGGGGNGTAASRATAEKSAEKSASSTTTVPASSVRFEIRWFPRVSEARPLAPTRVGKDGDDLMKFLEEEISNDDDDDDATEIILEGRQITTIYCGSLLGPVHVVGGSKAVDALGGTPAPEATVHRARCERVDAIP